MLFKKVGVIKYLLGGGKRFISRQPWLEGLDELCRRESDEHEDGKDGGEAPAGGRREEASRALAVLGLAILNEKHLESRTKRIRVKRADVKAVQELVKGDVFLASKEVESPELLVGAVLKLRAKEGFALIVVAKLKCECRAVISFGDPYD